MGRRGCRHYRGLRRNSNHLLHAQLLGRLFDKGTPVGHLCRTPSTVGTPANGYDSGLVGF